MKRFLVLFSVILVIVLLIPVSIGWINSDEASNICPYAVKIDDQVYITRRDSVDILPEEGQIVGHIQSSVPITQMPAENNQANFDCVGQPYAIIDGSVYLKDKGGIWYVCEPA